MIHELAAALSRGDRISLETARELYLNGSDDDLKTLAAIQRRRFHKDECASYLKMSIVNYTNICVAKCDYCSFYRLPHQSGTYLLSHDQVFAKIDELVNFGGTLVGFNGGFHPKLTIYDYAKLFSAVHERYPNLKFYEMTVAEFMFSCKVSKISYDEGAKILKEHGTEWITGGGAEVLVDSFRDRHSPGKFKVEDYYLAQKSILDSGMGSTATMVIGFDETLDERLSHLDRLRHFQDTEKNALASFLCWTYKPFGSELKGTEISHHEYFRWIAICRIFLDNFIHIRTSVLTKNELALVALTWGANDFDLPTEDEVTQKAGATISHSFDSVLEYAKKLGINPVYRKPFEKRIRPAESWSPLV
jgi:cyclic dehypoxanthinyl futalosine synthase